jgi:hypothetical protein
MAKSRSQKEQIKGLQRGLKEEKRLLLGGSREGRAREALGKMGFTDRSAATSHTRRRPNEPMHTSPMSPKGLKDRRETVVRVEKKAARPGAFQTKPGGRIHNAKSDTIAGRGAKALERESKRKNK